MSSAPFFCPWDLSRQSILFCSFQKSKDYISTRLPHPSRHFSAICGYPAGRAAGRRRARSASEAYRTARQFEAWVRLGQPRSGRRPRPLGGETHGVGQAFGDRQTTKGGPPSKYQYGGPSGDFGAGHPPTERRGHGRAGHGRHVHLRGLRRELEAELAQQRVQRRVRSAGAAWNNLQERLPLRPGPRLHIRRGGERSEW